MKKTILRSLIVGLFAVVSLNASAYSWPFWNWMQPAQFHISGIWMEPNTFYYEEFYPLEQISPLDKTYQAGDLIMVSWYYSLFSGLQPGDKVYISGCSTYTDDCWADCSYGTHKAIPITENGSILIAIQSGGYAGWRTIGPYGPIVSYPVSWVGNPDYGEYVEWTGN